MRAAAPALLAIGLLAGTARADPADGFAPGSVASPGLGGDPFASAAPAFPGWQGLESGSNPAGSGVAFRLADPLGGRGSGAEWRRSEWRTFVGYRQPLGSRQLRLTLEQSEPDWSSAVHSESVEFRGASSEPARVAGLGIEGVAPGLALGAQLGFDSGRSGRHGAPWGGGARYAAGDWMSVDGGWIHRRGVRHLDFEAGGRRVPLLADQAEERGALDVELRAGRRVAARADLRRVRLMGPDREAGGPGYRLGGQGFAELWRSALIVRPGPEVGLMLRRSQGRGDLSANGRLDGMRFARLSYLRGDLESWLAGAEWGAAGNRVLADVERVRLRAAGRATVESWPFTDLLGDLLGTRENVLFEAAVVAWRAQLGYEGRAGRGVRWRGALHGYDLRLQGSAVAWQPAFLVFGVTDRREATLPLSRVQLGAISLGGDFRALGLELSADARQFVFARVVKRPAEPAAASAGDGTPTAPGASARKGGWPGGTAFSLAIRRPW